MLGGQFFLDHGIYVLNVVFIWFLLSISCTVTLHVCEVKRVLFIAVSVCVPAILYVFVM